MCKSSGNNKFVKFILLAGQDSILIGHNGSPQEVWHISVNGTEKKKKGGFVSSLEKEIGKLNP